LLAVALIKGLDVDFKQFVPTRIGATNIPLDPPPPPPPPDRAKPTKPERTFITAPRPLDPLIIEPIDVVVIDPVEQPRTFVVDPGPRIEPVVEPTRPFFAPKRARPTNDPLRWISTDDYPARALRAEAEGIAAYRLIVGTNGRVSACEVVRSTGNGVLDDATCDNIALRARFEAATDDTGAKVVGSYSGTVKWEIPN